MGSPGFTRASAVVFDAYGTLLDINSAMAAHAQRVGPEWPRISLEWRAKQLEYAWVRSLTGPAHHEDFWLCTRDALDVVLARNRLHDARLKQDLSIVVVDGFPQILDVGLAEVFGDEANGRIHEAKAGFKMQGEESSQCVDLRQLIRCPVFPKCSVASTCDAAHVAQPKWIDECGSRKGPGAALRPAGHSEFPASQCISDGC